jgi:hypothetical protein
MASRTEAALCAKVRKPRAAMIRFPSRSIQPNRIWSRSTTLSSWLRWFHQPSASGSSAAHAHSGAMLGGARTHALSEEPRRRIHGIKAAETPALQRGSAHPIIVSLLRARCRPKLARYTHTFPPVGASNEGHRGRPWGLDDWPGQGGRNVGSRGEGVKDVLARIPHRCAVGVMA